MKIVGVPEFSLVNPEHTVLLLLAILFLTEGLLTLEINRIVYTLMLSEHHDIWNEYEQRFAKSFEDVVKINLSVKLIFLNKHNFEFMSELCPRKIRNAIAHQNFTINSEGDVVIKNNVLRKVELGRIVDNIRKYLDVVEVE